MAVAKHTLGDKQAMLQMNSRAEYITSICALALEKAAGFSLEQESVQECVKVCTGVQGCV